MTKPVLVEVVQLRLNSSLLLHWRSWCDEHVIFDESSGQTYQMDSVKAFVLHALGESASNYSSLLMELSGALVVLEPAQLDVLLRTILDELKSKGLVEVTVM